MFIISTYKAVFIAITQQQNTFIKGNINMVAKTRRETLYDRLFRQLAWSVNLINNIRSYVWMTGL